MFGSLFYVCQMSESPRVAGEEGTGEKMIDVAIIGCGIVGAAAAYELSRYELDVVVLESENDVACGTSKANSAIIHAGYDPEPGSLMAQLNVSGASLCRELCKKLDVPYSQCGSLVIAFGEQENQILKALYRRGLQNGVKGLELWDAKQTKMREARLSERVTGALYAKTAAIVSPWEYTLALIETAVRNGVTLKREAAVLGIEKVTGGYSLNTVSGRINARYVLNAAGVHADRIHNMVAPPSFTIIPDSGEYYLLDKCEGETVSHVIFHCPTPLGKGTLIAPTVHGNLIVGPDNRTPKNADDTATTREGLQKVAQMAKKSVPSLNLRESIRNFAGVRAACDRPDFILEEAQGCKGFVDLAGIKSPGLSAAPAIAQQAVRILNNSGLGLQEKNTFIDTRKRVRFSELTIEQKQALIQDNPAYGRVICRCEGVTEGEILDALHAPVPASSIDAVKRRCGAGMGRCQGGFCGPRVLEILAQESGLSPAKVPQDRAGSTLLLCQTKQKGAL